MILKCSYDPKRIKPRTKQLKAFVQDVIDISKKEVGSLSPEKLEEMRKEWKKKKPNKGSENIERFNRKRQIVKDMSDGQIGRSNYT